MDDCHVEESESSSEEEGSISDSEMQEEDESESAEHSEQEKSFSNSESYCSQEESSDEDTKNPAPMGYLASKNQERDCFPEEDYFSDQDLAACPICLNKFWGQELGSPENCNHTFCLDCILEWSKNVNTCPIDRTEYLNVHLKHLVDGVVIKKIKIEVLKAKDEEVSEDDVTVCEVCHHGDREDRLLLCDGCDSGYHCECLDPPLETIPIEEWFCPMCRDDTERSSRPSQRQIARTRASEVVRSRIENSRASIISREPRVVSTQRGVRTKRKIKRKTKRKTPSKRCTKTGTKSSSSKKRSTTKTKRRKTRKRRKTKKKSRRSMFASRALSVPTVKKRIADRLGLCEPPSGRNMPFARKISDTGPKSQLGKAQEKKFNLSIFGDKDQLMDFNESYVDENVSSLSKRTHQTRQEIPSVVMASTSGCNILDNILQSQGTLLDRSKTIYIGKDGTLNCKAASPPMRKFKNCENQDKSESNISNVKNTSLLTEKVKDDLEVGKTQSLSDQRLNVYDLIPTSLDRTHIKSMELSAACSSSYICGRDTSNASAKRKDVFNFSDKGKRHCSEQLNGSHRNFAVQSENLKSHSQKNKCENLEKQTSNDHTKLNGIYSWGSSAAMKKKEKRSMEVENIPFSNIRRSNFFAGSFKDEPATPRAFVSQIGTKPIEYSTTVRSEHLSKQDTLGTLAKAKVETTHVYSMQLNGSHQNSISHSDKFKNSYTEECFKSDKNVLKTNEDTSESSVIVPERKSSVVNGHQPRTENTKFIFSSLQTKSSFISGVKQKDKKSPIQNFALHNQGLNSEEGFDHLASPGNFELHGMSEGSSKKNDSLSSDENLSKNGDSVFCNDSSSSSYRLSCATNGDFTSAKICTVVDEEHLLKQVGSSHLEKEQDFSSECGKIKHHCHRNGELKERIADEVRKVLRPYFMENIISKDGYKEIMRKSVPKIFMNSRHYLDLVKIRKLIVNYVEIFHKLHKESS